MPVRSRRAPAAGGEGAGEWICADVGDVREEVGHYCEVVHHSGEVTHRRALKDFEMTVGRQRGQLSAALAPHQHIVAMEAAWMTKVEGADGNEWAVSLQDCANVR